MKVVVEAPALNQERTIAESLFDRRPVTAWSADEYGALVNCVMNGRFLVSFTAIILFILITVIRQRH